MLDVREYDAVVSDSARAAAFALMSDTTALAIQAVLDGRQEVLGRRTMTAVMQLIGALTTLREQPQVAPGNYGTDVFKNDDITRGVGRLIGEEDSDRPGVPGSTELLELSRAVSIDSAGTLLITDNARARALAETLRNLGAALTSKSALTYARSRNSYPE